MRKYIKYFSLNPSRGLYSQPLFWVSIITPICISIALGIPVWIDYSLAFTSTAYTKFLDISKFPLGVCSLSIPLGVLVGRLHGTKQTAKQIENTEQDNKTKLYLGHFEHFCKYVEFVEKSLKVQFENLFSDGKFPLIDSLAMYQLMYPNNTLVDGIKKMDEKYKKSISDSLEALFNAYDELYREKDYMKFKQSIINIEQVLFHVQNSCFRFHEVKYTVFLRCIRFININNDGYQREVGMPQNLHNYYEEIECLLVLLNKLESFEIKNENDRVATPYLIFLRSQPSYRGALFDKASYDMFDLLDQE